MKHLALLITILFVQVSQAETQLREMVLESNFHQEHSTFRIWSEDGQYFIEQSSNIDRDPRMTPKTPITAEQVSFIQSKIDEMKSLRDSGSCDHSNEGRGITAAVLIDGNYQEKKGCVNGRDGISRKLNQLGSILRILI